MGNEVFLDMSRRAWAVCFFVIALLVIVGIRYRLAKMDGWFVDVFRIERARGDDTEPGRWPGVRFSWPALKGLTLYLAGADAPAARAYREHFQAYGDFGTLGGPMEAALMRGQPQVARGLAEEALRKDKQSKAGLLTLGRLALDEGRGDEALAYFARVLDRYEDQLDALLLSAVAHSRAGQNGLAIDTLLERLARALYEMGQLDEAKETIDKALALDPRRGTAHATLGFIYLRQEKRARAIQALERANWLDGLDIDSYAELCWLYAVQGAHGQAVPCLRWVLQQRPGDPVVRGRLNMAEKGLARQRARENAR